MDTKFREIQPLVTDAWVKYQPDLQEAPLVQAVAKSDNSGSDTKVDKESGNQAGQQAGGGSTLDQKQAQDVMKEVESYLKDFNISLSFNTDDKTGDVVVKVMNRDTGDVIRQIPPDALLKLREKLKELRGVIFDGKV